MAIVVPQIFAEAANSAMDHAIRIGRVAFDATELVPDITTCGDEVHFPMVDRIGDAEVMNKGDELTPSELSMTDNKAKIKQVGKAVRIYDKDSVQVKGRVVDLMANQMGEAMANSVDADLVVEMDSAAAFKSTTAEATKITHDEVEAGFDNFGDNVSANSFAGIIINSRLRSSFMAMPEFVKSDYTFAKEGNGVVDDDGVVGYYNGVIPVIVCNNNTYDTEKAECKTYIVKKNALGIITQKEASVEEQRESLKKATLLSADKLYAVKLLNTKGCAILRKTIA